MVCVEEMSGNEVNAEHQSFREGGKMTEPRGVRLICCDLVFINLFVSRIMNIDQSCVDVIRVETRLTLHFLKTVPRN